MLNICKNISIGSIRQGSVLNLFVITTDSEDGRIEALYTDSEDGISEQILIDMEDR